jgi:hypothetical protein
VEVFGRPVVIVLGSEAEAEALGWQLAEAVNRGWTVRGVHPPLLLLSLADSVSRAACPAGQDPSRNARKFRDGRPVKSSGQPEKMLAAKEAASRANVSEEWMRKCFREHALHGTRGARGAWFVGEREFATWMDSRNRKVE